MSLGRRITVTVLLTLAISVLSTVFCAPEAQSTEEPLSTLPVAAGPIAPRLPADTSHEVAHSIPTPEPVTLPSLPETHTATATIVTERKEAVVAYFQAERLSSLAQPVIDFAMAQLGDPYLWGGNGPNSWDCSGLLVAAFNQVGVKLPRVSRAQFTVGTPVAYGQWQPGDLLFYGASAGSIHHVVMYIGDGQIIHAPRSGDVVKLGAAPSGGGRDYLGAKRVL